MSGPGDQVTADAGAALPGPSGAPPTPGAAPAPTNLAPGDKCAATRVDAPPGKGGAVDVVFVVDTSGSMIDEILNVATNIGAFLETVNQAGADTRLIMVTGLDPALGTPLAADTQRYRFVPAVVDSGELYAVTLASLPSFADFLRPGAPTHLVMVTDDNDDVPGSVFQQNMQTALGRPFTLHAIASENVNGWPCANPICGGIPIPTICGAAAPGDNYYSVAQSTKGETLSICASDWTMLFSRLQSAVIASVPLPCDYVIPPPPANGGLVDYTRVQVVYTAADGMERQLPKAQTMSQCGDSVAWHYDDPARPAKVVLCPAACKTAQAGGSMDVAFGCSPLLL